MAPEVTKLLKPVYIYALYDPRTDEIRYIGGTKNPDNRVAQHMNSRGSSPKNKVPCSRKVNVADCGHGSNITTKRLHGKFPESSLHSRLIT